MEISLPLNSYSYHKTSIIVNRAYMLLHFIAIFLLIRFRISSLFNQQSKPTIPCLLVFASELLLTFIWLLDQAHRWKPLTRTGFPDRLPKNDEQFPSIDVFICTIDPDKEPTFEVMNTVVSAMALDYPAEKLNVYLSDDGGSDVTLRCLRVAYVFAKWWVPFRRRYSIKIGSPQAYFSTIDGDSNNLEFLREKEVVQKKYKVFEEDIRRVREEGRLRKKQDWSSGNHPSVIELIGDDGDKEIAKTIPLLVYVARQKNPSHAHNFKAGALNVLLRVSGIISNSPYILVLDCDMYNNDSTSAKQAMCFHLDPNLSPTLAYVQFPQKFSNISHNDIYDSEFRSVFKIMMYGLNGLNGPAICGTNFYVKRMALLHPSVDQGIDFANARGCFGSSNELIKSLGQDYKPSLTDFSSSILDEAKILASSNYEDQTKWGQEVGILYTSVLEDIFTSYRIHCKGWQSVYINPERPQFLGTCTTNLNDSLTHGTRGYCGLLEIGISEHCPLTYGPARLSFLQRMFYAGFSFTPLYCFPLWCFATIPPLCLLNGIQLFPEVSSPYFKLFSFIFISSLSRHLYETLITKGSVQTWKNENRIWMIKAVTSQLYGTMDAIMKKLNIIKASFVVTDKVPNDEKLKRYQLGVFDFRTSNMFLVPLVSIVFINLACLVGGITRVVRGGNWDAMFAQVFLSVYILVVNFAIIDGMLFRNDTGRISISVSLRSAASALVFLLAGSIFLMY